MLLEAFDFVGLEDLESEVLESFESFAPLFDEDSLESSDFGNEKKVFHYRFGSGYIVYDEDSIEDVVLVQFDSGFRKKVFIYDLENS